MDMETVHYWPAYT